MTTESTDVQDILNSLAQAYLAELSSKLEDIESIILAANEAEFAEQFENLFRLVHSMKGTAGSYGFQIITTVCHNFEDQLSSLHGSFQQFNEAGSRHWLAFIDLLRKVQADLESEVSSFTHIEEELARLTLIKADSKQTALHVLVVSTNQLYESIFTQAFSDSPLSLSYSKDGHEALGRLLNEPFDILVTDMEIPTLNGLALVGALRLSNNRNKYIKAILLSSSVPVKLARFIDPDFAIEKDAKFIDNLGEVVNKLIREKSEQA